jgi:ArsR family transcriptional regulator
MNQNELESGGSLDRVAAMIRCLGHPLRLRLLKAMEGREPSVSELQEHTGEEQATVSRQLAVLRARRVVEGQRNGTNVHYRIIEPRVHTILSCIGDAGSDAA